MSDEQKKSSPASGEPKAGEVGAKVPMEDSEAEEISGGTGGTADPRDRTMPDGWGDPDPNNPWSIP